MKYTDVLTRIRQIIRSVNLESKRVEKKYNISIPQLLCLNFLNEQENFQASHKAIKDYLKLNASTVTGIIARLEKKGYVARLPKKGDKRFGLITITANGVDLLDKAPEPLHEQLTNKLKKLPPEEVTKILNAFDTIIDFLNIEDLDAAPIITSGTIPPNKEVPS